MMFELKYRYRDNPEHIFTYHKYMEFTNCAKSLSMLRECHSALDFWVEARDEHD